MVRLLLFILFICISLLTIAGDTASIWSDAKAGVRVEALPTAQPELYIYRISYTEKGVTKQLKDTVEFLQAMAFDSAHVYQRQLDGEWLPELVFQGYYSAKVSTSDLKSKVTESAYIIWDLHRRREIIRCTPSHTYYVEQHGYDVDGKPTIIHGDCIQQYTVTINDKNQVVLKGMKDESSGPAIEHYLCDPLRIRMGVYQLNEQGRYEWLKGK